MTFGPSNSLGAFVPINQTFSDDQHQRLIQLTLRDRDIARYVNLREIAVYDLTEIPDGQQWFSTTTPTEGINSVKRDNFRTVVNFGALPNAGTKTVAHGIAGIDPGTNSTFTFTHIYATATNPTTGSVKFVPIPYVNVGTPADGIEIWVDATNVNIKTTTANWIAFTVNVVLEYLKN